MMGLSLDELWILAICALCAVACTVPGVFLMLRREVLVGDAISHSVLPGLAIAFLISGSRNPMVMLLGAFAAGLASVAATSILHRSRKTTSDASLGMVFTSFFALGVVLLSVAARNVDIDPGCVLYGLVEFAPLDTLHVAGFDLPRSFIILGTAALVNTALVAIFFKELVLATFDPVLAQSVGFNTRAIHYGLMSVVTVTIVASFEAVGSILVVSMLVAPAATGYLLANRIGGVLLASVAVAILSAIGGVWSAVALNTSVAGMMSVAAGTLFCAAVLFAPRNGIVSRAAQRLTLQLRITQDDILGLLFRWHETSDTSPNQRPLRRIDIERALHRGWLTPVAMQRTLHKRYITRQGDGTLRLTERGMVEARALVRSHRLWESYLAKHLGLPADHLHEPSERAEHYIGRALARELQKDLSSTKDPHGRKIP